MGQGQGVVRPPLFYEAAQKNAEIQQTNKKKPDDDKQGQAALQPSWQRGDIARGLHPGDGDI